MTRYLFISFLLVSFCLKAQEYRIGVPFITSFGDKEFKVSNQNWDIIQDERGVIYCANDDGILEFDGSNWTLIQSQPNMSITRSLAFGTDNKLYSGAQDFFGYLHYSQSKGLNIIPLSDLVPVNKKNFGNVWKIFYVENKVIFYTWNALFIYENERIKVVEYNSPYKSAFKAGNRIFLSGLKGLMELKNDNLEVVPFASNLNGMDLAFILPFTENRLLIGTLFNGLYVAESNNVMPFQIENNNNIFNSKLQCGILLKNGLYVTGTAENGLYLINNKGKLLQHISKANGLSHNHVRQLFEDKDGNWWVLNEKGIDVIEASSPFFRIVVDPENPSSVYSTCVHNNNIYAASPTGLFYSGWNNRYNALIHEEYRKIYNAGEVCWKLDTLENRLYLFSGSGLFEINYNSASPIFRETGTWAFLRLSKRSDIILAGTYEGLAVFSLKNGKLIFKNKLPGFNETSRVISEDYDGNVWVSHGYKGVYKILLSKDYDSIEKVSFYDLNKGFPGNLFINVFKVNNEIVFGTQHGTYIYDRIKDSMVIHPFYAKLLGTENHIRYLKEDKQGNIWYVMGNFTGVIIKNADGSYTVEKVPYQRLSGEYFPGFENFWFFDNGDALVGTKNSIIYYNKKIGFQPKSDYSAIISRVSFSKDQTHIFFDDRINFFNDSTFKQKAAIVYKLNSLRFDYTACFYENADQVRYSCYLEGHDEDWSDWSYERIKEYTNLREGNYVFHVKAKNVFEEESKEAVYRFTISAPYYRTIYAYILYLVLIVTIIWIIFKVRNRHFEKEKAKFIAEQEKQRTLEQVKYHEEKLMLDIESKNKELAASAMKVIYKNEKMLELKKLIEALSHENSENYAKKIASILQFIEKELKDDQWDDFELRFDQANNNFVKRLKIAYPDLSSWDLKVCAYLKMNLSTKEIAQILNMSVRGVETARFRIRKRIGLEQSESLSDFILRF